MHHAQGDEERVFLGLASKPRSMVSLDLASKLVYSGFPVGPQNRQLRFDDVASKSARPFLGLGLKTKWAMVC
jgi:hypothetical protein